MPNPVVISALKFASKVTDDDETSCAELPVFLICFNNNNTNNSNNNLHKKQFFELLVECYEKSNTSVFWIEADFSSELSNLADAE